MHATFQIDKKKCAKYAKILGHNLMFWNNLSGHPAPEYKQKPS